MSSVPNTTPESRNTKMTKVWSSPSGRSYLIGNSDQKRRGGKEEYERGKDILGRRKHKNGRRREKVA